MQSALSVSELTTAEFTARLDDMVELYAAAMDPARWVLPSRRSVMAGHSANPGFRALLATVDGTGEPAAFSYGFHGAPGQWWHDTVARALEDAHGQAAAAGWLEESFEVAELHVSPDHQGHGTGARLLQQLTSGRPERTALLSTRDADTPARRLYRGTGFTDLLTRFVFFPSGDPPYAVMGAELPLRALTARSERPSRS
jgi:GNAT superfamily N-acetyltransferase